jgi:hypothetical protein
MEATLSAIMPPWVKTVGRMVFRRTAGERLIRASYERHYGKKPDLGNPRTFSEKVFRRMIALERKSDQSFTALSDKYLVRDYVRHRIGSTHLIKLLWHGSDPRRIPFDTLPLPYIIKTNHGSGGHIFVRDQIDRADVIERLRVKLRENYYWCAREFQYLHIEPRVMIEEVLDDGVPGGPLDYRCWCFHGKVRLIQVDTHDHSALAFYDPSWRKVDMRHRPARGGIEEVPEPANLAELIDVAETLSWGIDFVRVDLYQVQGRTYFGELTFTPRAGLYNFEPEGWDRQIGEWW